MRHRFIAAFSCGALAVAGIFASVGAASADTLPVTTADELAIAFATAQDGDVLQADADIVAGPDDDAIAVPAGAAVTLDLNGYDLEIDAAAEHAGIEVSETASLVIEDSAGTGTLVVTGGYNGAGIGGSAQQNSGLVAISGGTVEATGGEWAAGIGGGLRASGGTTVISGGTVTATAGPNGAGIGGGHVGHAGTVTIDGGTVIAAGFRSSSGFDGANGAGIGGGNNGASGVITINGGTVTATGAGTSAGIGGGGANAGDNGGLITISGGEVNATGGESGGAGIGSATGRSAGPVIIEGGTVTATGGGDFRSEGGPGIGHSRNGGMSVTISGGTVTAIGGEGRDGGGAGIGGGTLADGTDTTITGGTVSAHGTAGGAGIGGGRGTIAGQVGSGATVTIGTEAAVTVSAEGGGNAIGQGEFGPSFGSLSSAGGLVIESGSTLTIPTAVTVDNSGQLTADGEVINNGTIVNTGTVVHPENVSVHHYLLRFDTGGTVPAPPDLRVFAVSLDAAQLKVPTLPERVGHVFDGWYSLPLVPVSTPAPDDRLTGATELGAGADGPLAETWQARWSEVPAPVWTGSAAAEFTVGAEASAFFLVSGADSVIQTSGVLPEGLTGTVTTAGVTIAGSPAADTEGEYSLEYTATAAGQDATLTVTLTIVPAAAEPAPTPTPSGQPSEAPSGAPTGTSEPEPTGAAPEVTDPAMPVTGTNLALPVAIALVLLIGGVAAMLISRRRRQR